MLTDNPFIIYRLPGSSDIVRIDGNVEFDGTHLRAPGIELTTWLGEPKPSMPVPQQSTEKEEYTTGVDATIARLRREGGKTVLCRTICGGFGTDDRSAMPDEYFAMFPDMFCCCAYHPLTGCWMCASPELLLLRHPDGSASTRALAGTRRAGSTGDWDSKNMEEHRMVIDDICRRATSLPGYTATAGTTGTLSYGTVEHLATPIEIHAEGGTDIAVLIAAIHPTAAIAGYPLKDALEAIAATERHPRNFYGGTIVAGNTAYVVLRCVHFDNSRWCIYTGSGITAHSSATDEWLETEAKATPLLSLLKRY